MKFSENPLPNWREIHNFGQWLMESKTSINFPKKAKKHKKKIYQSNFGEKNRFWVFKKGNLTFWKIWRFWKFEKKFEKKCKKILIVKLKIVVKLY